MKVCGGLIVTCMDDTPDPSTVQSKEAFDKLIWGSGEICNNCFSKVVDIDLPEEYLPTQLFENYGDIQGEVRQYDDQTGTIEIVESAVDEYGAETIDHPGTVCLECGSVHLTTWQYGFGSDLTKQEAKDRIPRLADRLEEYGYDPNVEAMYTLIKRGKERKDLQGKDKELFSKAVQIAIDT